MKKKGIFITFILIVFTGLFSLSAQENLTNNKEINELIAKKRAFNKSNKKGYRVQLYNGLEKRARSIKSRFQIEYPGVYTKLTYKNPEWKVQVGNYRNRLEADRALNKFREKFASAIVIPL